MGRPTKITVIIPYKTYPAKMGGQKFNALVYQYLSGLLPVTIISTKNNEAPSGRNIVFIPMFSNSRSRYINPFLFFRIRNEVKKNNTTHLNLIHPYMGWLGLLVKWFSNVKLVIQSHNIEALRFKSVGKWWWGILWHYEKFIHRKADINFFVTEEDRQYAITHYKADPKKCHILTYGFEFDKIPAAGERANAKKKVQEIHGIDPGEKILFFNGTLDYKPNLDAVDSIINHINPVLLTTNGFRYKIIICGRGLPAHYNELKDHRSQNIIYAGFVDDITIYFKAADIFINPVIDGGGIKTKLVEALGYNVSSVSTQSGANGVSKEVAGTKIAIVPNADWEGFTREIIKIDTSENTGADFFNHFYWGNIAKHTASIFNGIE